MVLQMIKTTSNLQNSSSSYQTMSQHLDNPRRMFIGSFIGSSNIGSFEHEPIIGSSRTTPYRGGVSQYHEPMIRGCHE